MFKILKDHIMLLKLSLKTKLEQNMNKNMTVHQHLLIQVNLSNHLKILIPLVMKGFVEYVRLFVSQSKDHLAVLTNRVLLEYNNQSTITIQDHYDN